jgi:DNA-binding ferritin-like protein
LNLEQRKAEQATERQESLDRENERRAALGLPAVATYEELADIEDPVSAADILLNQAALTVAEIAADQPTSVRSASRSSATENDGV